MANNQSVRRHLDAFTRDRIIGKLEEGRSVTRTAIHGFSSGCPRGTTPADDRYIVLQARRNRRQTAGEIARHTTRELRLALQDEWAAMPQQLIDTLIFSMGRCCETCLAVKGNHIP
ncbi:hypothetical protein TNCV_2909551 [Trichonephila clavipes]|nr:hypothetical protein TNCV_2909551 [Trichonephila clavipes]